MAAPPPLSSTDLAEGLSAGFGIEPDRVKREPLGNAAGTWIFHAMTADRAYFVKLKEAPFPEAGLRVARTLRDAGLPVVAPEISRSGLLWSCWRGYGLMVFPWVDAPPASEAGMLAHHWTSLGGVLRRVHETTVPRDLGEGLERETFVPYGGELIARVDTLDAWPGLSWWRSHGRAVRALFSEACELGAAASETRPVFRLCHGDVQTPNILVRAAELLLVDWDAVRLAPSECDLMHVPVDAREAFLAGYGEYTASPACVAFFERNWLLQELLDYLARIASSRAADEEALNALEDISRHLRGSSLFT